MDVRFHEPGGGLPMIARAGVFALVMTAIAAITTPPLGARVSHVDPICPPGHSVVPTSVGLLCAHDVAHGIPVATRASAARSVQPRCYGDGVSGNRVQLLYVYARGTRLRPGIPELIVRRYVPAIEGLVRGRSGDQGQELGLRLHMPGCKLRVDLVEMPASVLRPEPVVSEQVGRIIDELSALGFDQSDRKYLVWVDAVSARSQPNKPIGPCGIGTLGSMDTGPAPNPFDQPTAANYHNGLVPQYALAFASPLALIGGTPCWGAGTTGADTEAHELFHTLGAVQLSAPNSNGLGHCTDAPDLMCYREGGIDVRDVCTDSRAKVLDCGGDDYFNAYPALDSYPATHWNTARSSFLGDALLDGVPIEIRRP